MLVLLFLVRDIVAGRGDISFGVQIDLWLWFTVLFATFAEAMAEARGKAQAESLRKTKSDTIANRLLPNGQIEKVSSTKLRAGDVVVCVGRRGHSRRRRGHRGRRHGRRIGHHGRKRAGHPRIGRRPQRGDGRHARAVGPDQDQDHVESRRNLPRSHDCARRRRRAAEDAERNRLEHHDRRLDDHLPVRRGDPRALRHLQRDVGGRRHRAHDRGVCGAARLPDSDDHRRPALGHRHRRHGPRDAAQRAGDERQGGGGGRRRQHAAARQDRHHHAGQPPGGGVRDGRPASPKASWPMRRSCPAWPTKRPKGARLSSWPRRNTGCGAATWRRTTRSSSRFRPTRR